MSTTNQVTKSLADAQHWDQTARNFYNLAERVTVTFAKDALQLTRQSDFKGQKLIDIACGSGGFALHAKDVGFDVLATDFSQSMLDIIKERQPQIATMQVDGQTLEGIEDDQFDFVTSFFGIYLFPDRLSGWKAARRVLKDGGTLLTTVPNLLDDSLFHMLNSIPSFLPEDKKPEPFWNGADYREILPVFQLCKMDKLKSELVEAGFKDVKVYTTVHSIILEDRQKLLETFLKTAIHVGQVYDSMSESEKQKCNEDFFKAFGLHKKEGVVVVPASANIALATK